MKTRHIFKLSSIHYTCAIWYSLVKHELDPVASPVTIHNPGYVITSLVNWVATICYIPNVFGSIVAFFPIMTVYSTQPQLIA